MRLHYVLVAIVHPPKRKVSDCRLAATGASKFEMMVPVEWMRLVTFAFGCLVWAAWSFEFDAADLDLAVTVERRSY